MANLLENIQCAGSDTQPPMLDRTDFASWQQCIRLYYRGIENMVNILKLIDEGPFQMGTGWEPLTKGIKGAPYLGHMGQCEDAPVRVGINQRRPGITTMTMSRMQLNSKFVNNMLPEWGRFVTTVKLNRGLKDFNYDQLYAYLKQHEAHVRQNRGQGTNPQSGGAAGYGGVQNKVGNANPGQVRQIKCYNYNGGQANAIYEDVDEQPLQDLALNVDNVFQADECNVFDSDVDEAPTAQTMFMANLSFADSVNYEASPSYDSDILSEDQYAKDNVVSGVQSNVSSVLNDAFMMIYNDMYEPHAQSIPKTSRNTIVDNSLTAEHATYKEQVELYERRAMFELTEREQKINEQLSIVITDHNFKEESLKKELHSDFKQKENKYLEDFLDMKSLKEKVEDRLFKQDQSLQTVCMLCRPKPYYNELNKVAISYKNPLCLTHAKQVQPALYNRHEIIKDNHVPAIVHNTEDTLKIAEIIRRKMNDKMKDPEYVNHKVKIAPLDYSKENFLATFTPQKQLTPEQIFWSQDLIKRKTEALKEQTTASRPIKALTVYPLNTPATFVPRMKTKALKEQTTASRPIKALMVYPPATLIPMEHFEGIQKALTKEMKDVFEELEAEVAQNVVDRKQDEIERKNLLIENDNLITECLSKELFSVATNFELNVARFTEMHVAKTIVEARCLELEAELFNFHGVNRCTDASGSQPMSNTKKNKISPAKGVNKMQVEEQPRTNMSHLRTMNRVDSSSHSKSIVINSNSDSVCQTCNKCFGLRLSKFGNLSKLGNTRPVPIFLMPGQISSGLVPNLVPATPYVPPTNKDLEILFQPMFDEYLEPPRVERPVSPTLAVQAPVNSTGTPSSTTIDQDAPSL
nr:hypothetical protein [Tanacetum cinerariifolium]